MFWQEEKNIEYVLWDSHVLLSKNKSRLNSQTLNRKIRFVPGPYIGQDSKLFPLSSWATNQSNPCEKTLPTKNPCEENVVIIFSTASSDLCETHCFLLYQLESRDWYKRKQLEYCLKSRAWILSSKSNAILSKWLEIACTHVRSLLIHYNFVNLLFLDLCFD
jgi:hypothetical protein